MKTKWNGSVRMKALAGLAMALMLAGLVGCATGPERRIQKNPDAFAALSPEEQETVRAGQVEIGYTKDKVYLALGSPERRVMRRTADTAREIWVYQGRFLTTETVRVYDQFGRFRPTRAPLYLDRTVEHIYTRARLEFVEGRLVSIEQVER